MVELVVMVSGELLGFLRKPNLRYCLSDYLHGVLQRNLDPRLRQPLPEMHGATQIGTDKHIRPYRLDLVDHIIAVRPTTARPSGPEYSAAVPSPLPPGLRPGVGCRGYAVLPSEAGG